MANDSVECPFCFKKQRVPLKFRDQPHFPCKDCETPIMLDQHIQSSLKVTAKHTDFGGPFGLPWPLFILIALHHIGLIVEIYLLIVEIALQPARFFEIIIRRVIQIVILVITVCGFHFRWQWFWSMLRALLFLIGIFGIIITIFSIGLLNGQAGGAKMQFIFYCFILASVITLSIWIEFYALGLTSTRAYFGFACPNCNSLQTRISIFNTDKAECINCKTVWSMSMPSAMKRKQHRSS